VQQEWAGPMTTARPDDHAYRMEASLSRVAASRRLCLSTAEIIREARVTIERTWARLDRRSEPDTETTIKMSRYGRRK